jgi:hypothetical protein
LQEFSIVFGIVIAFWTTYGTRYMPSEWAWRLPFLLQMIPGLILGAGILFLPYSPRWLASKGRDQEGLENLAKLRRLPTTDSRVYQEMCEIRAEVAFNKEVLAERHPFLQDNSRASHFKLEIVSWMDCFKRGCWRRTLVGTGIVSTVLIPRPSEPLIDALDVLPAVCWYQCAHVRILKSQSSALPIFEHPVDSLFPDTTLHPFSRLLDKTTRCNSCSPGSST